MVGRGHAVAGDGTRLWFEDRGEGPPIVFVHEFGGEPASWDAQVEALGADYRCVRYAARGFEPSDVPDDEARYGQPISSGDLVAVLDHLQIGSAHLVGTSMGSFTALDVTLTHPDRVRSLTLVGNSSGPRDEAERERYRDGWVDEEIRHREQLGGRGAVAILEADPAYRTLRIDHPDVWAAYAARLAAQSVDGALHVLRRVHRDRRSLWDDEARLRAIACPVLLVHGDEDYFLVGETNDYLEEVIPQVRRVVFIGAGHLANIEMPQRFNTLLRAHVSG